MLEHLPNVWQQAHPAERRSILNSMLGAVYADPVRKKQSSPSVPRPPFRPLFGIGTTREAAK